MESPNDLRRLIAFMQGKGPMAIAVSGGVDSMTLGSVAHRYLRDLPLMVHAVSPAVPAEARERLLRHAEAEGWRLKCLEAGELDDPRYRANPYDRCYFCKSNLYHAVAAVTSRLIASGTNLDDLDDYRPGLVAAQENAVVHPFVAVGMDKQAVRRLARGEGLTEFSELPAQPCLASRVETGIAISADDLRFVDAAERAVRAQVGPVETVRVRLRRDGVYLELSPTLAKETVVAAAATVQRICVAENRNFVAAETYRQGAAFLKAAGQ